MKIWLKWLLYYATITAIALLALQRQHLILMPMLLSILSLLFFAGPLLLGRWHFTSYYNHKRWRLPKSSHRALWIFSGVTLAMILIMPTTLLFLTLISSIMIFIVGIQLWVAHAQFARFPSHNNLKHLALIRRKASLWWVWLTILLFILMIVLPAVFLFLWSDYL